MALSQLAKERLKQSFGVETAEQTAAEELVAAIDSAGNGSITLAGDVTGSPAATVVSSVGGSTAANVHSAELAANGATVAPTANVLVKRDANAGADINVVNFGGVFLGNFPTGGSIGTAATTVDIATAIAVAQTTAAQTLTLPNPTVTGNGRMVHIANTGTTAFTILGKSVTANSFVSAIWTGSAWVPQL